METREIHSQAEYEANKDFDGILIIKATELIIIRESSRVEAWGSSSVEAWGSSRVVARESSRVVARESSRVEARESSRVEARESSRVEAWGSSSVEARGSSSVEARESSRGKGMDNASFMLYGDQIIELFGNATKKNWVQPSYDKTILPFVGEFEGEKIVLYKSVNPETNCDFRTGKIKYEIGALVEAPDFDPDTNRECGGGLHLSFTAAKTQEFNMGKILKCLVDPADIVVFHGNIEKVRCRAVRPVAVVDRWARVIE